MADGATGIEGSARRRLTGMDRNTIAPSLLVLGLGVLMSIVLPSIERDAPYRHPLRHDQVAELAAGITLVPTAGWDLATGALAGHTRSPVGTTATTEIVDGGVKFVVQAAPFAATPSALLRRIKQISARLDRTRGSSVATRTYTVRTTQGAVGVGQDLVGVSRQGSVVAFVFRLRGRATSEGVEVVASGPKGSISRRRDDIVAMIRSIRATS